jgi:hypothetical protein
VNRRVEKNPVRSVVLGWVTAGLLAELVVAVAIALLVPKGGQTAPVAKNVYPREEFRRLVVGKTSLEVLQAVGKPDGTSDVGDRQLWYYDCRTLEPASGKTDRRATLIFRKPLVCEDCYF